MPEEQHDRLSDPFYPPPPARRGSFIGGPGIIFVFLILLIAAGIGIYGAATGNLSAWTEAIRRLDFAHLFAESVPEAPPPATQPTQSTSGSGSSLVLTPMGPAELLAARTPPRSLRRSSTGSTAIVCSRRATPRKLVDGRSALSSSGFFGGSGLAHAAASVHSTGSQRLRFDIRYRVRGPSAASRSPELARCVCAPSRPRFCSSSSWYRVIASSHRPACWWTYART